MALPIDMQGLVTAFLALFIILDPFVSLTVFIGMTYKAKKEEIHKAAFTASSVAFVLLFVFLLIGTAILTSLGIDFASFKIAGGLILLIMGVQQVLGLEFKKSHESITTAAVVIGTPLLAGPGAISTTMILSKEYGFWIPFIAICLVCFITYLMLYFAEGLHKIIGPHLVEIGSRVLGLLLAAIAVTFIRDGITMMIAGA
jgi:multiple antibiotic resistance protein